MYVFAINPYSAATIILIIVIENSGYYKKMYYICTAFGRIVIFCSFNHGYILIFYICKI